MTLEQVAETINETCGYEGEELTQATLVYAALLAGLKGNTKACDYFVKRAEEYTR